MSRKDYTPTIGLEIHAELKTLSKMFCSCSNNPDESRPNTNICPICLGHPGTLPVLNYEAIKHVLRIGIAVDGTHADFTEWDRKNYFYPDIPKGYQITQYKYPLVSGGTLANVALERIHLEEDTAQSTHDLHEKSLVNFNRSGVPLMELVTKPVIHDSETAVNFAKELQLLIRYLGVGEANMEKGEMRVEANISVSPNLPDGSKSDVLGTKTEVKNLNSFRSVEKAIEFEIERHIDVIEGGGHVVQETRGWDDIKGETYSQRSKEGSKDYRYFPEPDIPKLKISEIPEFSRSILEKEVPELPESKRVRFTTAFGMTPKEIAVCVENPTLSKYYESVVSNFIDDQKKIKLTTNYLLSDYLGLLKKVNSETGSELTLEVIPTNAFAELITMLAGGDLSSRGGKDTLLLLIQNSGSSARALAEQHDLIQKSDLASIVPIIEKIISDNPTVVADYKAGKLVSLQFLIGQAMKLTKGSANPEVVKKLLLEKLAL